MKVLTQSELHNVSGGNRWRNAGRIGVVLTLLSAAGDAYKGFRDGWRSV